MPTMAVVTDHLLQDFMIGVFGIEIGLWYKSLGKIINETLQKKKLSPKLKSVLLSCFFSKFQLSK
jgi:hypothetical protein